MRIQCVGIIAEYDPFHRGHAYQIQMLRRIAPDAAVVVALGGNLTQRGMPAMFEAYDRAKMALVGGADLVLSLPFPFSCASASWFATAGVEILARSGVCDALCFGSECGDVSLLSKHAKRLDDPSFSKALREARDIHRNVGLPALQQAVYHSCYGELLPTQPNDMLGIEYLRALHRLCAPLTPIAIQRHGNYHDIEEASNSKDGFASAGLIRRWLSSNDAEKTRQAEQAVLPSIIPLLRECKRADLAYAEAAVLWKLSQMRGEEIDILCDIPRGTGERIISSAKRSADFSQLVQTAAAKQFTTARMRRMLWYAFFGVQAAQMEQGCAQTSLLAANARGCLLLRQIRKHGQLQVFSRPAKGDGALRALGRNVDAFYALLRGESPHTALCRKPYMVQENGLDSLNER